MIRDDRGLRLRTGHSSNTVSDMGIGEASAGDAQPAPLAAATEALETPCRHRVFVALAIQSRPLEDVGRPGELKISALRGKAYKVSLRKRF